jgi:ubiquinone/menaquinone biosynthesis C-methylase UbiE
MNKTVDERLAGSLTAETTELLPFLPYLLQDFWELGSDPSGMADLIKRHIDESANISILDLACGKGAVSVAVAKKLQAKVKGVDLIPEFIDYAEQKAKEHGVTDLCSFEVGDINEAVKAATDYDVVILGAAGDALGAPAETLDKLKQTIKTGGYILIDECYLKDDFKQEDMGYNNYEYLTGNQWSQLFADSGLELVEALTEFDADDDCANSDIGMAHITRRANELIENHPDKKAIFEGYIRSQQSEYDDIDSNLEAFVWILKKL